MLQLFLQGFFYHLMERNYPSFDALDILQGVLLRCLSIVSTRSTGSTGSESDVHELMKALTELAILSLVWWFGGLVPARARTNPLNTPKANYVPTSLRT